MTVLPITLTVAGAAAIINLWLGARCAATRVKSGVLIGDGSDPVLIARMRAQANFVEYTPFVLILVALIELAHGSSEWLWGISIFYLAGRLLHPFGLDKGTPNWMRGAGVFATMATLILLAGYALYLPYSAMTAPTIIAV